MPLTRVEDIHFAMSHSPTELYGRGLRGMRVTLTNTAPESIQTQHTSQNAPGPSYGNAIVGRTVYTTRVMFMISTGPAPNTPPPGSVETPRANATDKWHSAIFIYIPQRDPFSPFMPFSISFRPTHGPCTEGVAMTELTACRGMIEPRMRISSYMPASVRRITTGYLHFVWPDYPNTRAREPLALTEEPIRPDYLTRGMFGEAVSRIFRNFIDRHGDEYVPPTQRRGFKLGEGGIKHDQLRLLEVFSLDGYNFFAPVSPFTLQGPPTDISQAEPIASARCLADDVLTTIKGKGGGDSDLLFYCLSGFFNSA
ncbi:hypothetical protein DFH09DRAFT_1455576 [Mycena vulgaris]|nr:hypothetical protein DFH09DRAFT_1455576 [Mycena vulgaris]